MMSGSLVIAAACGLAAALCNLAPLSGTPGGLMLNMVAPLPIFLAGLMQGWLFSLVAGLVAGAITLAVGGPVTAAIFCGIAAVPATVLVRQALLAQQTAEGDLEWYPADRKSVV